MNNMKKATLVLGISALAVNVVSANGIVTGPVEPNTTAPVATGYNSIAGGANTTVTASNSVALGRDNNINADNTVVIGGGNGNVIGGQSTVIGYNNVVDSSMEQVIIGANSETAGQGSTVIGTHGKATAWDAIAVGNNTIADRANSLALGTNSVTDDAVNQLQAMVNNTTYVFAGTDATSVVSVGSKQRAGFGGVKNYVRQVQNVAAGRVDASSTDAVNGSQLHAAYDAINTMGEDIDKALDAQQQFNTAVHNTLANHKDAIKNNTQRIAQHDADIANNKTAIQKNATNIDKNAQAIATNKQNIKDIAIGLNMLGDVVNDHEQAIANNTKAIAGNTTAINNNANRINGNTNAINTLGQKVATNTADIRVLENVADNHEQRITTLENRSMNLAKDINNKVNNLGQRVNKLGASSAALAGLHPLDFNRNDKASYAVSYGHYRNANAVALGAFYRPNERTMIGAGVSLGGETQLTLNVAFKTGKGSDYLAEAKDKDSRISKLEAMVQKLMAEVEQQKAVK